MAFMSEERFIQQTGKKNSPFVVCRKKEAMVEHTVRKQVDTRGRGGRGVAVGSSIFKTTIKNSCIKKI